MTNPTPHGQAPEALRLALSIDLMDTFTDYQQEELNKAAAELRRQHARIAELESQLEAQPAPSAAADLIAALEEARSAINSMKVEAETAGQGDEQMMLEACETISNEGLQADIAIRAALASASQPSTAHQADSQPAPVVAGEPVAWLDPWSGTNVTTDPDAYGKHGIPLVRQQPVPSKTPASSADTQDMRCLPR